MVEYLLRHGASAAAIDRSFHWVPHLMPCLRLHQARALPSPTKRMWVRFNVKLRFRLGSSLRRARDRLDRPPSSQLGTNHPTREELIAQLRTAGRRFARDYWTDGIPLFLPDLQASLGPVPDEFVWQAASRQP